MGWGERERRGVLTARAVLATAWRAFTAACEDETKPAASTEETEPVARVEEMEQAACAEET